MNLGTTYMPGDNPLPTPFPDLGYTEALDATAPNFTSIVAEQRKPDEPWWDTAARLLPALAATYQQRQLLQIQVERARQGLPPIDAASYGAGVNVGLAPDTRNLVMWGGAALLLVLALTLGRR